MWLLSDFSEKYFACLNVFLFVREVCVYENELYATCCPDQYVVNRAPS